MKRTGREKFTAPGPVPAPECDSCGTKMVPASVTEWKCTKPSCPEKDKPKLTGVYPVG
jgi:uncharacterized OB-fold protein